jgi:hypothetical protein
MNKYTITQTNKELVSKAIMAAAFCLLCGCSSIGVYSSPSGARVFMNDVDTGLTTPASIRVKNLPMGRSYITVVQDGYISEPRKQEIEVHLSVGQIIWSWFPPVLVKNLCGDFWKGVTYPPSRHLADFVLQPASGAPSATTSVQPEIPMTPLQELPKGKPITNADVVAMTKANLSESTIIAAIKQGPSDFDTSPTALIELKKQDVTDEIQQAMMQTQNRTPPVKPLANGQGNANVTQAGKNVQQKTRSSTSSLRADHITTGEYVIGMTTKADVIAKLGEPNGRGVKADGSETLSYASSRFTGKAFNPFYFGNDNMRKKVALFIFDRNGVLLEFSVSEERVF